MALDIARYLDRVGLCALPGATIEEVAGLQQAHRTAIGFENLDIPLGRGVAIDTASIFDKLVTRGRGGYCFEHNGLYAAVLRQIGVHSRPLLARVWLGAAPGTVPARTHVCLLMTVEGQQWIGDAGFGGSNVPPLPMTHGAEAVTADGARHRLLYLGSKGSVEGEWRLERAGPALATDGRGADHLDWQPQYSFSLDEVAPADLEQANHWTSTRPGTRFTTLAVASIPLADGFASMVDRELTVYRAGDTQKRTIGSPAEYVEVLRDVFRISLNEGEAGRLPIFA